MADEEKLHLVRVRCPGSQSWLDPELDIRTILPTVMSRTLDSLEETFKGTPQLQDVLYLNSCLEVFNIRAVEDSEAFDVQLSEFVKAISKVDQKVRQQWLFTFALSLLCLQGLYCRRDCGADKRELRAMLDFTERSVLRSQLKPETWEAVRKELPPEPFVQSNTTGEADVVCVETGDCLERVKDVARRYVKCYGNKSWNEMSRLCDEAFSTPDRKSREVEIALCLAYPSYENPTLQVEETRGLPDETGKAETP